ncbi:hypothetical protein KO527_19795 [Pseudoalteromonas sp. C2R02]|uniref:hypothetical protein n=1 Tax=Pseudoalteromonas sp. C2R02 TaxID=2841565 RepID=UPI001C099B98|nr:hypothetical protein [Pseudoalteromonas sp. C2R02]MBU2971594.1 hypothetical protein [Pseudoalteromonas sp. C2R02]
MKKVIYALILLLASLNVSAKLMADKFDVMVLNSQIIVEATPIHFENNKTTFEINSFYKGEITSNKVTITR